MCWSLFSLCPSADSFHNVDDKTKEEHSETLSALLCLNHVLPLACSSEDLMRRIFISEDSATLKGRPLNFHAKWTLDGWNDHIIQPARDAVLDYYKVCMLNISSLQCLRLNSFY